MKVGDKVKRVRGIDSQCYGMFLGHEYIVIKIDGDAIWCEGAKGSWVIGNFEVVAGATDWIPLSVRKPEKKDAEPTTGYVLISTLYAGKRATSQVEWNHPCFSNPESSVSAWMTPPAPYEPPTRDVQWPADHGAKVLVNGKETTLIGYDPDTKEYITRGNIATKEVQVAV